MIVTIHQPNYLPWLGLFHKVALADLFMSLDNVSFSKGGYGNRNRIKTSRGIQWMTIPVYTKHRKNQFIHSVQIDQRKNWQKKHFRTLEQNYSGSPFFDFYHPWLQVLYSTKIDFLADVNEFFIRELLEKFEINTSFKKISGLDVSGSSTELIIQVCKSVGATGYLSGPTGRNYLDLKRCRANGIEVIFQDFKHPVYPQRFGKFVSNLSAIDFLLNCGGESFHEIM